MATNLLTEMRVFMKKLSLVLVATCLASSVSSVALAKESAKVSVSSAHQQNVLELMNRGR